MKVEPYAFWCSKCQVRHAGDCPPPTPKKWSHPIAPGTLWRVEIRQPGAKEWTRTRFVYEVKDVNAAATHVKYEVVEPTPDPSLDYSCTIAIFGYDGVEIDFNGTGRPVNVRFVPRNEKPDHQWAAVVGAGGLTAGYRCAGCGKTERLTVVQVMTSSVDGTPLPLPWGPCP